jgi:Mrp family chromosome partitioning ATPase
VLIDSAPLLAVSDTVPLLSATDGTIVVGRTGITTSTAARRLLELIARVPDADVLGVAVNDVTNEAFPGGYSYYGYYGYGRPSRSGTK